MIRYSSKIQKVIFAVRAIATMPMDKPVRSKALSTILDIAPRYLEPALQQLVKHNVLVGHRGPKGGFTLKRTPKETSIGSIIDALNQLYFKEIIQPCDIMSSSKIENAFYNAHIKLQSDLYDISLADLRNIKTVAAA